MADYIKEDDNTLRVTSSVPGGGTLCRYFNFAAGEITTIFREKAEAKDEIRGYSSGSGVSTSVAVALTSQMKVTKFSELDSLVEVQQLHKELQKQGGNPPALEDILKLSVKLENAITIKPPLKLKP